MVFSTTFAGKLTSLFHSFEGSFVFNNKSKQLPLNPWIIDTGASDHMCVDAKLFETLTSLSKPLQITLPIGFEITITRTGAIRLVDNLLISNALLVPTFHYNPLPIGKLTLNSQTTKLFFLMNFAFYWPFQ